MSKGSVLISVSIYGKSSGLISYIPVIMANTG